MDAEAVGTRTFVLDTIDRMSGGDMNGVSVSSDGAVRAGLSLGSAPILGGHRGVLGGDAGRRIDAPRHEPERQGVPSGR